MAAARQPKSHQQEGVRAACFILSYTGNGLPRVVPPMQPPPAAIHLVHQKLGVPAGVIIGKAGSVIKELIALSAASIKVSQPGEMIAATLRPCGRFFGGERSPGVAFPTEKTRRNAPALRVWGESDDDGMPSGSIFVAVRFGLRGRSLSVIELGDVGS